MKFNLYPNPAQDFVTIEVDAPSTLQIFDMQGRLVRQQQLTNPTNTINTNDLKGTYFVRVISGKKLETKKLIVK